MPFIKICGLQSYDEARLALECGATTFGFLVGLTHKAEDKVSAATARDIIRRLPPSCSTVLVTHLLDVRAIADLADDIGANVIQVHGDVPAEGVKALREIAPHFQIIKAIHVTGSEAIAKAREFIGIAHALVLDSRTADRLGGTGKTHDWSISRQIVDAVAPLPVYLAGGLNPGNVEAAIARVRPAGVDVNSGVEDASGKKDERRLAAFIFNATKALEVGRLAAGGAAAVSTIGF